MEHGREADATEGGNGSRLQKVTSSDGTTIAFQRTGEGSPLVLIGGAFNDRTSVSGLAATLAPFMTTIVYDRRGRGDSGDTDHYSVEREIEDLKAVIDEAGGSASVFGHSSGANLALEASAAGLRIDKIAVYEPIFVIEGRRPADDLVDRLRSLTEEDRRDEAVWLFMTEQMGMPAAAVEGMQSSPMWAWLTNLAHTLPYDLEICGPGCVFPAARIATIGVPTLSMNGALSPEPLPGAARAVAETIPGARYMTVEGQDHGVLNQPEALKTPLTDFFG